MDKHVLDQLEPGSLSDTAMLPRWNTACHRSINTRVGVSIAISLKRIADALDFGDDDTNLAEIVAGIEMNTRKSS